MCHFAMIILQKILCCVVLLSSIVVLPFATAAAQRQSSRSQHSVTEAVILWNRDASAADSIDQGSYAAMMASMGFAASRLNLEDLDNAKIDERTLLLVPHASSRSLSSTQAQRIVRAIEKGLRLVVAGESPLLSALRIKLGVSEQVGVVVDQSSPSNHLHWADWPRVKWISAFPDLPKQILYADSSTGHPLAISARRGKGKYVAFAPHLDPLSGSGYSRFPTIVNAIFRNLGCKPPFRRQGVDAYFDPGYRIGMSMEATAERWREWGIRAVHAAAWYYNSSPPFDYKRLIDAAHKSGILVYAWLEWPHVGKGFWSEHPEWRQKNALLQDANLDWLHLMDLQNPDCMNAAVNDLSRQLELDWDGVDIAEFTITGAGGEALRGPSRPDYFTSFGTSMRTEFAEVGGFDPLELENPSSTHYWMRDSVGLEKFYQYRKVVNNRLLRRVVEFILDLEKKGKRDWELIHTIVDNSLHPEFDHLMGFDLNATLKLVKEFDITLNVEDPYMEWEQPPIRYRRLRETLGSLIPERASMIDINVVPIHPVSQHGFASERATGAEFLQQLQIASEQRGRVCVYCEWSVFEQDWPIVPHTMAGGSTIKKSADGWEVNVPVTVELDWKTKGLSPILDGKAWPCYGDDGIVLPAGTHQLSFKKNEKAPGVDRQPLRLVEIGGELIEGQGTEAGIEILYTSPARCLLTLNRPAAKVLVDGIPKDLPVFKGVAGYIVFAPSGMHRISMTK